MSATRLGAIRRGDAPQYPFVPLFKEAAGALVVTYVSVLMLPIVANLELLMRFGNWREPSTKVGAVFAILTAVFAIWTVVEIHRLRRLWFKF